MDIQEAANKVIDAAVLIRIAYDKLFEVEKKFPISMAHPLKDVLLELGTIKLALYLIESDYLKKMGEINNMKGKI